MPGAKSATPVATTAATTEAQREERGSTDAVTGTSNEKRVTSNPIFLEQCVDSPLTDHYLKSLPAPADAVMMHGQVIRSHNPDALA
jgi:hypothetical protein